jgi:uncharacterized delta-60 repeat protein
MHRARAAVLLSVAAALAAPAAASAAAGSLDPSFASGGIFKQQLSLAGSPLVSFGDGVVVRANGSVRVSAEAADATATQRLTTLGLTSAGALDAAFAGGTGLLRSAPDEEQQTSIAAAPGDKLVVAGTDASGEIRVERYNADGTPDTSFHTTGAFVFAPTGTGTPPPTQAAAVTVDGQGRVIVAGTIGNAGIVLRLTAAGNPDTSFNTNGYVVEQFNQTTLQTGDGTRFESVAVAPDGDIIVGGDINFSSPSAIEGVYAALTDTGALDPAVHGGTGVFAFQSASGTGIPKSLVSAVVAEPDNSVLVGGAAGVGHGSGGDDYTIYQANVLHFSAAGALVGQFQHNFGSPGVADYGADSQVYAMTLDSAGRVILAGYAGNANGGDTNSQVLLARLAPTADALDATFGTGGATITPMGPANNGSLPGQLGSFARGVAMTPDNKIVVSAVGQDAAGHDQVAVARYENASTTAIIKPSTTTLLVGQKVVLDGSASTGASSPIVFYAWDLNDDGTIDAAGSATSTSFSEPGTHVVRLTVTDADGLSATTTQTFSVTAPPAGVVKLPHLKFKLSKLIKVSSSGHVGLAIYCYPPGPCKGSLVLTIVTSASTHANVKHRAKTIRLGSASFSVSGGKTKSVSVKLTTSGRRFLIAHGHAARVSVAATLRVSDHEPVVVKTTTKLRLPAAKRTAKHH